MSSEYVPRVGDRVYWMDLGPDVYVVVDVVIIKFGEYDYGRHEKSATIRSVKTGHVEEGLNQSWITPTAYTRLRHRCRSKRGHGP